MNYKGYLVDNKYIVDGVIKWTDTGPNGKFITGTKDGKKYFIKKNVNNPLPVREKIASDALYNKQLKAAKFVENKQNKLAELMKGLSFDKDHVAVEEVHFWDEDNLYVTVTRFVEDAMDTKHNYAGETQETKRIIMLKEAEVINKIHTHGVIHSDLKVDNLMLKKSGTAYDAYVIDFDASLVAADIPDPDHIPYTNGYESPEIILYRQCAETMEPEDYPRHFITPATDVFTLGIMFHMIWTGSMPDYPLKDYPSLGSALSVELDAMKPILDKSLDVKIGPNNGATFISLINWMLSFDPTTRPTSQQVVDILQDKAVIPHEFVIGSDSAPFSGLWGAHTYMIDYSEDDLRKKGVLSFQKVNKDGALKYVIRTKTGEETMTVDELIAAGYLVKKGVKLVGPWENDKIEYASIDVIAAQKVISIRNVQNAAGKKFYEVVKESGLKTYHSAGGLVSEGLATRKKEEVVPVPEGCELWPEDELTLQFNGLRFVELHIAKVVKTDNGGEHAYRVIYNNGSEDKILPSKTLQLLSVLIRK